MADRHLKELFDRGGQARRRQMTAAAVAAVVALGCLFLGLGDSLQLKVLDSWFSLRKPRDPSGQVVIVGIDSRTLNKKGTPPWPRDEYVEIIDRLSAAGAKVIGFDITLQTNPREVDNNQVLAEAMARAGNVVFPMAFTRLGDRTIPGDAPDESLQRNSLPALGTADLDLIRTPEYEEPEVVLAENAAAIGHANSLPDTDGKTRWYPLLLRHGSQVYPSLGLQMARLYTDTPRSDIELVDGKLRLAYADIPVSQSGEMLINWPRADLEFVTYSYLDVLNGEVADRSFADKAVLVAWTAEGMDDRLFPFVGIRPGVLLHAAFLDNFFTVDFLASPSWLVGVEYGLTLLLAALAVWLFPRLPTGALIPVGLLAALSMFGASLYLFLGEKLWARPLYPTMALLLPLAVVIAMRLRHTEKVALEVAEEKTQQERLLGLSYQEKGLLDMALAQFNKLPMTQDMKIVYLNLGIDFHNRGLLDKAFLAFKRLYDVDPNFQDVAGRLEVCRRAGIATRAFVQSTVLKEIAAAGAPSNDIEPVATAASTVKEVGGSPYAAPTVGVVGTSTPTAATVAPGAPGYADRTTLLPVEDHPTLATGPSAGAGPVRDTPAPVVAVAGVGTQFGRYRIVRKLGRGAMGEVYEVEDSRIGRRAALKTIRPDVDVSPERAIELRHRFYREAQTAGKLTHPNIVTIYDVGEEQGISYIVMEYVDGATLTTLMREGSLRLPQIKRIMQQAALGLDHAHQHGIFHRDVKPDNIMIARTGVVKVMDFGIARLVESDMTRTGSVLGTPVYMAPEQFSGRKVDARSDVFSLGVVLFELLTGRRPFAGQTTTELIYAIVEQTPPPPSAIRRELGSVWDDVLARALAKKPEDRYASAREFGDAVRAIPDK